MQPRLDLRSGDSLGGRGSRELTRLGQYTECMARARVGQGRQKRVQGPTSLGWHTKCVTEARGRD